jgi:MFS transporter, ACS family, allantoate permease
LPSSSFLILHAASANFGLFFAFRFLLGVFECCVSPILIAYISAFYPRHQQAKRISCFYCMSESAESAFGALASRLH